MNILSLISRNALMAIVMDCEEIVVGNKTREQLEVEVEESLKKRVPKSEVNENNTNSNIGNDFVLTSKTDATEMQKLSASVGEALAARGAFEAISYFKAQRSLAEVGIILIPMECLGLDPEQFRMGRQNNIPKDFGKNFEDLMGSQDGTPE